MTTDDVTRSEFDELYRTDWHAVVALGWTLSGSRATGEELAQDAFLDAYRRWDDVGALDRPGAWVRRAVANRAVSHRRHLQVVAAGSARLETAARVAQGAADAPPDTDPDFWAAVRALPERQAQVIALHYLEDMDVAAIAALLDVRGSTVRVHLSRGRRTLARTLTAPTPEEDA
ncbi:sigma-70 family RNA polymerase sigma factor [Iamia sp. SCSIO 61187]|uniref:RNA polymerase sigma factor n=1 Tax=Iamia sp. SCSIO 61187 TaxID=2722752 RepID=UPI001C63417C|nr:sigma-70 family RNA polymerase sigma factor [Iamia sp. SCSIO 61187]QYG91334.1 sigma-70 family RNA polymerase sigma factor [Iamia sp. SCSIO 61187]